MNILLILVDQWTAWAFGHRGANIATPNLDRLADQSTVFTNAFTSCPLCTPARSALLTARWPHQTGVYDNCAVGYSQQASLPLTERTLIDEAVRLGYHVGYFGKWHLGPINPERRGAHRFDPNVERLARPYDPASGSYGYERMAALYEKRGREELVAGRAPFWGEHGKTKEQTQPFPVMASGVRFLEEWVAGDQRRPFFLALSSAPPHFPHYLPAEYAVLAGNLDAELPASIGDNFAGKPWFHATPWWPCMDTSMLSSQEWRTVIAFSHSHIMLVDEAVGRVMDALGRLGLADSTTVVFASDHGDMEGAHNRFDKGPYFYEEVWRIPLLMRLPGKAPAIQDAFVSILDVGETCFRLIGSEPDPERPRQGRALLPLLGASTRPNDWRQVAHGVYDRYNGMSFAIGAVRDERWKYVWNPQDIDEVYDLDADPHELVNLSNLAEFASHKERLREELMSWRHDIGDPLPEISQALPPAGTILATGERGP